MKNKKMRYVVVITILIALGIIYYYYTGTRMQSNKKKYSSSDNSATKIINMNLSKDYPKDSRAVVKLYSQIIKCYYLDKYSDEEKKSLAMQGQKLMDDELLSHNKFDTYYENLCNDIKEYKKSNKYIKTYLLDDKKDVKYKTLDKKKYSFVNCTYYVKSDSGTEKTKEKYVLRCNDDGQWKILYWKLDNEEKTDGK